MTKKKTAYLDFSIPNSASELAPFLGTTEEFLLAGVEKGIKEIGYRIDGVHVPFRAGVFYRQILIPKKSNKRKGQTREVWKVGQPLKDIYKLLGRRLDFYFRNKLNTFPHQSAYGYIKGRNILENASLHTGAKLIIHADIDNFFPSISKERIRNKLLELDIKDEAARLLSEFLTIDDKLALGLNTSPMIANLVCMNLDEDFEKLANEYGCKFSRYADDITISGEEDIPNKDEIVRILEENSFKLSESKFRVTKNGQSHYVTGLSVSDPNRPRIPRPMKRKLLLHLHYIEKYGLYDHLDKIGISGDFYQYAINHYDGLIRYVRHIEREKLPNLTDRWQAILQKEEVGPSYESHEDWAKQRSVEIFVDESEISWNNKKYLALCMVASEDSNKLSQVANNTLRNHIVDPFADGDKKVLEKKGLHFVDSTEDLKHAYVKELRVLPLRAYIAFCEVTEETYTEKYYTLIQRLIRNRLMFFDQTNLTIVFEENSKVKPASIEEIIVAEQKSLLADNNRCPNSVDVITGAKDEYPTFSAPDYFLGVFGGYAKSTPDPKAKTHDRKEFHFETLRDKIRLILNVENNIVYSRKNPFSRFENLEKKGQL